MQQGMSLQAERLAQVATMASSDVDRLVDTIRRAESIAKLSYHLARHGVELGVASDEEYLQALRSHLARPDLRIFTYLRARDLKPMWELVAPETGATAMYHHERGQLWSFFRPVDPDARMTSAETWWVEAIRTAAGWRFEERWQWKP